MRKAKNKVLHWAPTKLLYHRKKIEMETLRSRPRDEKGVSLVDTVLMIAAFPLIAVIAVTVMNMGMDKNADPALAQITPVEVTEKEATYIGFSGENFSKKESKD